MAEFMEGLHVEKKVRKENLKVVSDYLTDNGFRWFIMCGTLLGCMRDKDFIDWDSDIDIGVVGSDFRRIDIGYFTDLGFRGLDNFLLYKKTSISLDGCKIDFYNILEKKDFFLFDIGNSFQYEFFRKLSLFIKGKSRNGFTPGPLLEGSPLQTIQNIFSISNYKYFPKEDIVEHCFVGIPVYIPSNWRDWLFLLYGKNWHIPNPNYSNSEERQRNRRVMSL